MELGEPIDTLVVEPIEEVVPAVEEEQLRGDHVGDRVLDLLAEEDDPLAEQARVDVEGAFVAAVLLHDHGDEWHRPSLGTAARQSRAASYGGAA